jgi:hypothetical protein
MALPRGKMEEIKHSIEKKFITMSVVADTQFRNKFFQMAPPGDYKISMFLNRDDLSSIKKYLMSVGIDYIEYKPKGDRRYLKIKMEKPKKEKPETFNVSFLDIPGA